MIIIGELINASRKAIKAAIEKIVAAFPGIRTACGLSNISYGLPARKFMNQTFMTISKIVGISRVEWCSANQDMNKFNLNLQEKRQ